MSRKKDPYIKFLILTALISLDILLLVFLSHGRIELAVPDFGSKTFTDVIKKSGISSSPTYGGVAWGDYNNDGYLDLLLPDQAGKYHLYRNNRDETFIDVTEETGLGQEFRDYKAAVFGDYNNDGCEDIYFSAHGPTDSLKSSGLSDSLYRNNCNGTFTDISRTAKINDSYHGYGAAWGDYDRDGFLDIYVANWGVFKSRSEWSSEPNILYHNNGDGTFTDVTTKAGVSGLAQCKKYKTFQLYPSGDKRNTEDKVIPGLKINWQPIWFDYDNDGWPDLYVSHESGIGALYHNNKDGTFADKTEEAGLCQLSSSHGLAVGDYNNDGYLDLYAGGTFRNLLWKNNGNGTFTEVSERAEVANFGFLSWGVGFLDYDNDGYLDIYSTNGVPAPDSKTKEGLKTRAQLHKKFDQLYKNNGDGTFKEISNETGLFGDNSKSGMALGDYNNDGFTDVFITSDNHSDQINSSNRLYRNRPNGNNWLTIQLKGMKSNRDGIGARIILKNGALSQIREVGAGSALLSENSLWQTFGLGKNKMAEKIDILWPSGIKQSLKNIRANQKITIEEKNG